jgi:hypothetical protein
MVLNIRMIAVTALLVTTIPHSSSARQPVVVVPTAAKMVGFVIEAEPEVVERAPGVLRTRAIYWTLRARYRSVEGRTFNVIPTIPKSLRKGTRDTEVLVKRAWNAQDTLRRSRLFTNLQDAVKRFRQVRMSGDTTRFGRIVGPAAPRVVRALPTDGPRVTGVGQIPPMRGAAPKEPIWPTCKEVLLEKGHAAMHLSNCKGVPNKCAVTLLEQNHSPIHLRQCKPGQNTMCVMALLRRGHSPIHLDQCRGLRDTACAVKLLERGDSPIHLSRCK